MNVKNKKFIKWTGLCLAGMLALSACGTKSVDSTVTTQSAEERVESDAAAEKIREKYAADDKYVYTQPVYDVARDEHFPVQMGFDITNGQFDNYTQLIDVYQDSGLTQSANAHYEWDEEKMLLTVMPSLSEQGGIYTTDLEANVPGNDGTSVALFDKGETNDWGNLPEYYVVQYVDLMTGEALEKPIVTVFTVEHEIKTAPKVSMQLNDKGLPEFSWKDVKGATNYYVMSISHSEDGGYQGGGYVLGSTTGTTWSPEDATHFRTYNVSEAERSEVYNIEKYGEGTDPIMSDSDTENYFCVIATSDDGTSAISNAFSASDLAKQIPYTEEVGKSLEEASNYADGFGNLPTHKWITMCDGKLVQRLINYDYENAKATTETWATYEKEDMSDLKTVQVDIVKIPYTIAGTGFTGIGVVQNYNPDTVKEELVALKERQEGLRNRGGSQNVDIDVEEALDDTKNTESDNTVALDETGYTITASSALSEYLAANMLAGNDMIDLNYFPESVDQTKLVDAWSEAVYQNPLILGVSNASISYDGKTLYIEYDSDADTMQKKQKEITAEVDKVIGEIITDDMSELDKELAINQYLCDTAEYDMDALENAEENNFETVDEKYNDSFTPYGVLVNKVGVCASYSGAFKLLADAAGLESIVVTGYLDGDCPHAWNKVKINDTWQIVDSTNNDNEQIFNALLNLSNAAADKVLVEDDRYLQDSVISDYAALDTENEYYHLNNKYYTKDSIATALATEIKSNGTSVLRTDYNLNDDEFNAIGQQVLEQYGANQLAGYYWMGVIYITNEE